MDKYDELIEQIQDVMFSESEDELEYAIDNFNGSLTSIPLTNETLKNKFLEDLKNIIQNRIRKISVYSSDADYNIVSESADPAYFTSTLDSRLVTYNLEKFFKEYFMSYQIDFKNILRSVELFALGKDKDLIKSFLGLLEDKNAYSGLIAQRDLEFLEGDIRHVQYQSRLDKLLQEIEELYEKARSGEIDSATFNKQRKINQAETERMYLEMETSKQFTLCKTSALRYRADKIYGQESAAMKEESLEAQDEYKKLRIETSLKYDEILFLQGAISETEYREAEELAVQKLEQLERAIQARKNGSGVISTGKSR